MKQTMTYTAIIILALLVTTWARAECPQGTYSDSGRCLESYRYECAPKISGGQCEYVLPDGSRHAECPKGYPCMPPSPLPCSYDGTAFTGHCSDEQMQKAGGRYWVNQQCPYGAFPNGECKLGSAYTDNYGGPIPCYSDWCLEPSPSAPSCFYDGTRYVLPDGAAERRSAVFLGMRMAPHLSPSTVMARRVWATRMASLLPASKTPFESAIFQMVAIWFLIRLRAGARCLYALTQQMPRIRV